MKRALVISGGGALGNYSVGAVQHLLGEKRYNYDLYCGVSAGSIIASYLAQFSTGQEKLASDSLSELFGNQHNKDVMKHWLPLFFVQSLWKGGLYNPAPLKASLQKNVSAERIARSGKRLIIGGTCMETSGYEQLPIDEHRLVSSILASSAVPGVFPPVKINGKHYFDGAVRNNTPLKDAIDAGATHIDVLINNSTYNYKQGIKEHSAFWAGVRAIEILVDDVMANDVKMALLYNELSKHDPSKKHVEIRVIRPTLPLGASGLDFNPETAKRLQERGYQDAVRVIGE